MPNLLEILGVLHPVLSSTNIARLSEIALGVLHLSLPVTTRSISQASNLSLRTLERFYAHPCLPWLLIRLSLFKSFFFHPKTTYLFAGDETTEPKSGKSSYGLGRFYSSIFKRPIPSVSFLGLSMVNTQTGKSSILSVEQLVKDKPSKSKKNKSELPTSQKNHEGAKKAVKISLIKNQPTFLINYLKRA